jgi:hypothetical protein
MSSDDESIKTPTRSELNTFKVLANLDFTNLDKPEPTHRALHPTPEAAEASIHVEPPQERPKTPSERSVSPLSLPQIHRNSVVSVQEMPHESPFAAFSNTPGIQQEVPKTDPAVYKKAQEDAENDVQIEKEALLYEIELMEKQGLIKLHRQLTMANSLEEIQYQYDRANMIISTQQTVDWAKTGIKFGSGVLEALLKRFGISVLDGFSNNLCKDMNKFNKPLTKMYRKYWRRGTSSPEMELAMIVFGALAMTVAGNKGILGMGPAKQNEPMARPVVPPVLPTMNTNGSSAPKDSAPSILRPPTFSNETVATNGILQGGKPAIPDWARQAMEGPAPKGPTHFANDAVKLTQEPVVKTHVPSFIQSQNEAMEKLQQWKDSHKEPSKDETVNNTFPEVAPVRQPVVPVAESVRRVTITGTGSPRSVRRRKEAAPELNLDI